MEPELLRRRCRELSPDLRRRVRPEVAGLLAGWAQAGTRVTVISATLMPLARELAEACSASDVIASRPASQGGRLTGGIDGPRPWGRSKAELASQLLERISVSPDDAAALGDSWSDRHILRLCGRPVAVSPEGRLRRLADREGWRIIEGRRTPWA
jgi:phosphoserine phosphatase